MKTKMLPQLSSVGLLVFTILSFAALELRAQPAERPVITSIHPEGTNLLVTVRVPAGLRRIMLECRQRLGSGAWEPRAVARLDGVGGLVSFRLPRSRPIELMRVRADATEPLPASFYTGTNAFYEQAGGGWYDVLGPGANFPGVDTSGRTTAEREVVESDIWKIRGQTLFFFNQLRGLQVIDLTNPDAATVRASLELPTAGEDMYLLGDRHVVLLARDGCSGASEVILVAEHDVSVSITARLPVAGMISESRLVGTALYVASESYQPVAASGGTTWEWGTTVSAFDLAQPEAPIARSTLWFPGYGNVVTATDRLLFVATQHPADWWRSIIRSIDITSPDGTMRAYETIEPKGRIPDKFKLRWEGGILTTISEDWRVRTGRTVTTMLETFRLSDPLYMGPAGVVKLGELELGRGERLHATRFDRDRVYVVTFFQIDPLWVVDLADPASPRIAGSVDVPGWSTFIQPLDDRLVTVGIETNRVAVSLFNVANPAAPALLSRVLLGQSYSWSEANTDEKAFTVLPEAGLVLVPYSGDTTNGYASRVQLIDLHPSSLAARGIIEHTFQPRRATLYGDRILSISGAEYLSVDATDRDHPAVRGSLALAWQVDRVFVEGAFVVQVSGVSSWIWWGQSAQPVLRVAPADQPNDLLTGLALTNLPVLGATTRDRRLYLAQGEQSWGWPILFDATNTNDVTPPRAKFLLTVVSLDDLPALRILGQTQIETDLTGSGADLQPIWPKTNVLVWAGGSTYYPWLINPLARNVPAIDFVGGPFWYPWWGGGVGGRLLAFDVGNPTAPELVSAVNLSSSNRWNFSKAFTAKGLVFVSHQTSEYVEQLTSSNTPTVASLSRSYLDVVDYAEPREPLAREPVNIPGMLNGISHAGAVLYTVGTHWTSNTSSAWIEYLDASSYDGVTAHLIDALALPQSWPRPLLIARTNIFLGWTATADATVNSGVTNEAALETWYLADTGKLTRSGRVALTSAAQTLANFDALLAVQQLDNTTVLFDASDGAALRRLGDGRPNGCYWFDLTRGDGDVSRGLWVPLGAYGVAHVSITP